MWTSNENFPKTKVVELEKLHKFGIQHFFILAQEDRDNFSLQNGPWTSWKSQTGPYLHLPLCFAAARPYATGGPRPRRVRGQLDPGEPVRDTWMAPWPFLAHRHLGACHAAPPCAAPPLQPPPRRRAPLAWSDLPQSSFASPLSPPA